MALTIKSFLLVIHNGISNITLRFCVEDEFIGGVRPTVLVHHTNFYGVAATPAEITITIYHEYDAKLPVEIVDIVADLSGEDILMRRT